MDSTVGGTAAGGAVAAGVAPSERSMGGCGIATGGDAAGWSSPLGAPAEVPPKTPAEAMVESHYGAEGNF